MMEDIERDYCYEELNDVDDEDCEDEYEDDPREGVADILNREF